MKIPSARRDDSAFGPESMTPMIDVVFLLLVFFVCASAGVLPESTLPTPLGEGVVETTTISPNEAPDPWEAQELTVHLQADGDTVRFLLNEQLTASRKDLQRRLASLRNLAPESVVLLRIDDGVPMQQFVHVYDGCRRLKFRDLRFLLPEPGK